MVDPFTVCGALIASMQFIVQLKTYVQERRRRKRQELQEAVHPQQHLANAAHGHTQIVFYSIYCHVYQPSPCLHIYWPHHNPYPCMPTPHNAATPYGHHHNGRPQMQHHLPYSNTPRSVTAASSSGRPHYDWRGLLGGRFQHIKAASPEEVTYGQYGMRTRSYPYNNDPFAHWKSLQDGCYEDSIGVVNLTMGSIDMFVKSDRTFFRNYQIMKCDVAMFVYLFKDFEVFTGQISQHILERSNKKIEVVENFHQFQSINSWTSIGIMDATIDKTEYNQPLFVKIIRGAIFGLISCLYETPHDLEVTMERSLNTPDIVRISTQHKNPLRLSKCQHSLFSVFSFGKSDWVKQEILVG